MSTGMCQKKHAFLFGVQSRSIIYQVFMGMLISFNFFLYQYHLKTLIYLISNNLSLLLVLIFQQEYKW